MSQLYPPDCVGGDTEPPNFVGSKKPSTFKAIFMGSSLTPNTNI